MDKNTTIHLMQYRDGVAREVQADEYEPVEFNDWKFDQGTLTVVNKSEIVFPEADHPWGEIDAVKIESTSKSVIVELDHPVRVSPLSGTAGKAQVKFKAAALSFNLEADEQSPPEGSAEEYLLQMAESVSEFDEDFEYVGVEVPDIIAGKMAVDPRINITNVEKGEFGLDLGTMVLDFKIDDQETVINGGRTFETTEL